MFALSASTIGWAFYLANLLLGLDWFFRLKRKVYDEAVREECTQFVKWFSAPRVEIHPMPVLSAQRIHWDAQGQIKAWWRGWGPPDLIPGGVLLIFSLIGCTCFLWTAKFLGNLERNYHNRIEQNAIETIETQLVILQGKIPTNQASISQTRMTGEMMTDASISVCDNS